MNRLRERMVGRLILALVLTFAPEAAHAVDGVIEINQARVAAGGITAGDTPFPPATINESGSYRLTGNLSTPGVSAIRIEAPNVTLDLNGFTLSGNGTFSDGIFINTASPNVEIRNGAIRDYGRYGIFSLSSSPGVRVIDVRVIDNGVHGFNLEGQSNLVRGCSVTGSGDMGARILGRSMFIGNMVWNNTGFGLLGAAATGYGQNVFTGNNGGSANPQVSGGIELGGNVCGFNSTCP